MADAAPEGPGGGLGASSELRRSVGAATERIHEIIDAAERVALEIRADAEREAAAYLAERRNEADRLVGERTASLDQLTRKLADNAERFKRQAEQTLGELDAVIAEARAGLLSGVPPAEREPELRPVEPGEPAPAPEPEAALLSAYPGGAADEPAAESADATAEALLRATQLAVTGKGRDEVVSVLRADFPSVDAESIADEILG
jgi:hypothetical protein